jgi:hypothetical protein
MMNPYQLSAERKLLGCLMDKFVNRTVLLTQIPERLFTGNNILLYRAIESLHKATSTSQTKAKPMSYWKASTPKRGLSATGRPTHPTFTTFGRRGRKRGLWKNSPMTGTYPKPFNATNPFKPLNPTPPNP